MTLWDVYCNGIFESVTKSLYVLWNTFVVHSDIDKVLYSEDRKYTTEIEYG